MTRGSKEAKATAENDEKKFSDTHRHREYRSLAGVCQEVGDMEYDTTFGTKEAT